MLIVGLWTARPALAIAAGPKDNYGLESTAEEAQYKPKGAKPQTDEVYRLIGRGITVFLSLVAIIFLGLALYAGLRWMTARGNEEYVTKGKDTLEAAIIGLTIVVASYAIVKFVLDKLGGVASESLIAKNPICQSVVVTEQDGKKSYQDTCGRDTGGSCTQSNECDTDKNVILKNCCPGGNENVCCAPK